nr:cellulose biosynthesis protein BcsN [Methylobacterium brachythecii]
MPAWIGKPIRLREHDDSDTFEQAVSLSLTPRGDTRENLIMVTVPRSRAALERFGNDSASVMGKPTEQGIRAELEAVFPGTPMQVVQRPASNGYGPYGLAIGRSAAGARCLYAWQWIEEPPALQAGESGHAPLSLRVRLCRSDITLEAMAAAVNQLRLVPRFEGQPVDAPRVAMVRPAAPSHGKARLTRVAERRVVPEAAPRAEAPLLRAGPPIQAVPSSNGRRYLGADTSASASPMPSYAAPAAAVGISAARAPLVGLGGRAAPAAGTMTADLPPEAYRGPASNPTR